MWFWGRTIRMYDVNVNKIWWRACMNDSKECALVFFLTKTILNKSLSALQTWNLPQTRKRRDGFQISKTVICVEKDPYINEFRCRYRLKLSLEYNWQWSKTRQRLQNGVSCDMMSVSSGYTGRCFPPGHAMLILAPKNYVHFLSFLLHSTMLLRKPLVSHHKEDRVQSLIPVQEPASKCIYNSSCANATRLSIIYFKLDGFSSPVVGRRKPRVGLPYPDDFLPERSSARIFTYRWPRLSRKSPGELRGEDVSLYRHFSLSLSLSLSVSLLFYERGDDNVDDGDVCGW